MTKTKIAMFLVATIVSTTALAKDKEAPAVNASTKETFAAVSGWVRKEMSDGGRYAYVTTAERSTVDGKLTEMSALLDKSGSVDAMNADDKTKMFNDQEEVNAILARRDGERLVCKNVLPIGSHIPVKTCKTMAQIEQERRNANQFMQDRSVIVQNKSDSR